MHESDPSALRWYKSPRSGTAECVEVAHADSWIWIRDSKNTEGAVIRVSHAGWRDFVELIRTGVLDR